MEAIGVVTATIVQASAATTTIAQASAKAGQGGLSNLQRFKAHRPHTFKGGGDPLIAIIGSGKWKRYWRPWRLCPMPPR